MEVLFLVMIGGVSLVSALNHAQVIARAQRAGASR
jgi:hypothetical protein